jgi:hypothetical protein
MGIYLINGLNIIFYFGNLRNIIMRKSLFSLVLLIVAGSFFINLFVENENIKTTSHVIGLFAIIIIGIVLRIKTSNSSEN